MRITNEKFDKKLKLEGLTLDEKYKRLASLPIRRYGRADLAKVHDLTATALYGNYQGIDIAITHALFPIVRAHEKADEDNIPLFGWKDDGWLTMTNTPITNYQDEIGRASCRERV